MVLGSKHVGANFKCFNVKFYVSAFFWLIIKVFPYIINTLNAELNPICHLLAL